MIFTGAQFPFPRLSQEIKQALPTFKTPQGTDQHQSRMLVNPESWLTGKGHVTTKTVKNCSLQHCQTMTSSLHTTAKGDGTTETQVPKTEYIKHTKRMEQRFTVTVGCNHKLVPM